MTHSMCVPSGPAHFCLPCCSTPDRCTLCLMCAVLRGQPRPATVPWQRLRCLCAHTLPYIKLILGCFFLQVNLHMKCLEPGNHSSVLCCVPCLSKFTSHFKGRGIIPWSIMSCGPLSRYLTRWLRPDSCVPAVSANYNLQPLLATHLPPSFDWPAGVASSIVDGQRWDTWGRLTQALFSTRPHLATIGTPHYVVEVHRQHMQPLSLGQGCKPRL